MNRLKKILISFVACVPFFGITSPVLVRAAPSATASRQIASVQDFRTRKSEKIEERVAADKSRLTKKLTAADETRIKNKCKAAQNLVSAYGKKVDNFEASRQVVYTKITDRLASLATKLEAGGRGEDAETVKMLQSEIQVKIDEVSAAIDDFQQALSDLATIDCAADPTAFQAVLESARLNRTTINEKTKAVREYYAQTLVKSLSDIKNKLGTVKPDDASTEEVSQ